MTSDIESTTGDPLNRLHLYLLAAITAMAAFLACWNLDNTYFWDDEAYTALFSRNLVEQGSLTGWDGRNLITFRQGSLLDQNLESINPPLGYWLCALSFKILGPGTVAGRLPFALIGVLTVPLTFLLCRHLFPRQPAIALWAATALALNISFILYAKQCRYYAPIMFFGILTLLLYLHTMRNGRRESPWWPLAIAASGALLFFSHFMMGIALMLSLGIVFAIFEVRRTSTRGFIRLLIAGLLFVALTAPYAVVKRIWVRPDFEVPPFSQKLTLLWWHLREFNTCVWLPWMLVLGGGVLIWFALTRGRLGGVLKPLLMLGVFFFSYLFVVVWMSPQDIRRTQFADTRYVVVLLPLCAVFTGVVLEAIRVLIAEPRTGLFVAVSVLALTTFTNALALTPAGVTPADFTARPRALLPAYFHEITHDYPEPFRVVSQVLRERLPKDATVLAVPDYMNYPLMFYTGDHLLFRSQIFRPKMLQSNPAFPVNRAMDFDPRLFLDKHPPQYVVAFGMTGEAQALLEDIVTLHGYDADSQSISLNYALAYTIDVYAYSLIRPEIFWRSFFPIDQFDRRSHAVYVFRLIEEKPREQPAPKPAPGEAEDAPRQPAKKKRPQDAPAPRKKSAGEETAGDASPSSAPQ